MAYSFALIEFDSIIFTELLHDPLIERSRKYGSIVKKELSNKVHECPYCGFSCDRDYNASRNILISGMEQPLAPIESKSLYHISVMQVLAMKWEAAPFRARQFTKSLTRLPYPPSNLNEAPDMIHRDRRGKEIV
jgi:hypothetical protein